MLGPFFLFFLFLARAPKKYLFLDFLLYAYQYFLLFLLCIRTTCVTTLKIKMAVIISVIRGYI